MSGKFGILIDDKHMADIESTALRVTHDSESGEYTYIDIEEKNGVMCYEFKNVFRTIWTPVASWDFDSGLLIPGMKVTLKFTPDAILPEEPSEQKR